MCAAQHDPIDRLAQIRRKLLGQICLHCAPSQFPALDKLHQPFARQADDLRLIVKLTLECLKFLLPDGHGRGHDQNSAAGVFFYGWLERGLCSDHGNVRVCLPQQADGGGCCRVAGHDDGFGSGAYQMFRRRKAQRLDLRFALDAVGRVERVAVVQIVFLRQQPHRLTQDADPTEAGVKKRDRPILLLHAHASKNRTISSRSYSPPSMLMRSVRSGGSVSAHSS